MSNTTTCTICPEGDNEIPNEMFAEHLALLHADDPQVGFTEIHIQVPADMDPALRPLINEVVGHAVLPLAQKVQTLTERAQTAFMAGFREGFTGAVVLIEEGLVKLADELDAPTLMAKTPEERESRAIAYGLHRAAKFTRQEVASMRDGTTDVMTPSEIVHVLNGLQQPDWSTWQFAVCVAPGTHTFDELTLTMVEKPSTWPFVLGEIVIVDADGMEVFGKRRPVTTSGVPFEYTKNLEKAHERRRQVFDALPTGAPTEKDQA